MSAISALAFQVATQLGGATTATEIGRAVAALGEMLRNADCRPFLSGVGIRDTDPARFRALLTGHGLSLVEVRRRLQRMEGQIIGRLVQTDQLPEDEKGRVADLVAGKGKITHAGVIVADRLIRRPFLTGFMEGREIQPFGTPRHVKRSRLVRFESLEEVVGRPVYLKLESNQPVGSFKLRGATNLILHALLTGVDPQKIRIGTASHGNHAQGVVQAARNLGIPPSHVDVYLPVNASPLKIAQLKALGANVILHGEDFEDAEARVREVASAERSGENFYLFVPAFNHSLVAEGQGTIGVEIGSQMKTDFSVGVPTGGGGLVAGILAALGGWGIDLWGAESWMHPYVSTSLREGKIVRPQKTRHLDTLADGSALQMIGEVPFESYRDRLRQVVAVPEEDLARAIAFLYGHTVYGEPLVVEGAAAATVAALLSASLYGYGPLDLPDPSRSLVLVISGRNIDQPILEEVVRKHGDEGWKEGVLSPLYQGLHEAGFLEGRRIRALTTDEEGVELIRLLMKNCPEGWDIQDLFQRLDFGPEASSREANLNRFFAGLGRYVAHSSGAKGSVLRHDFANIVSFLVTYANLIRERPETREEFREEIEKILPLGWIGCLVVKLQLDGCTRLWPHLTPAEEGENRDQLELIHRRAVEAIWDLA